MTLLDNLDDIYKVEQQIELIPTTRQSNRIQKSSNKIKRLCHISLSFLNSNNETTTLVETLFSLEANQLCKTLDDEFASLIKKIKHIELQNDFIQAKLESGKAYVTFCSIERMFVDILAKWTPKRQSM